MLGKLLKFEIKSTARVFLPIYGLLIILAFLNKFFIANNSFSYSGHSNKGLQIAATISMMTYVAFIVALFVVTLVVLIRRFYRNLLGDEGYLSFTLPVKVHSHIDAKLIITFMWEVLSLIVSGISIFIMTINSHTVQGFSELCMDISRAFQQYGPRAYAVAAELIILFIIGMLACILQIYASIVVGNLSGKHKMLAGFGVYVGFSIIEQIVASAIFTGDTLSNISFFHSYPYGSTSQWFSAVSTYLIAMIIFSLVFGVIFYFITDWMLNKKLNLE